MKKMKKILALMLCLTMAISGPLSVFAEETDVIIEEDVAEAEKSENGEQEGCSECGSPEGHTEECSQDINQNTCTECKQMNGHAEICSQYKEENPVLSVMEQLNNADSLEAFRAVMMAEENRDAVLNLTVEEIEVLMAHVEAMYVAIGEPSDDDDYYHEEMIETLTYLPAMECPECGEFGNHTEDCVRNISMLISSGTVGEKTISNNQDWNLSGDITLTGTITIKSGVKFRIRNDAAQKTVSVKRAVNFTGTMFKVEEGGSLQINGYDWNNGKWDEGNPTTGPVVLDGNDKVTATGNIIYCSGKLALRDTVVRNNNGVSAIVLRGSGGGERYDTAHNKVVTVEITRTKIEKCNATSGGGIYIEGNTPADYSVDIWHSMLHQCTAIDASAIYLSSSGQATITMRNSVVDDCDQHTGGAGQYGGAIRTNGNGNYKLTMSDCVVRNCASWKFGGGVYWNASGSDSELIVEDCQFLNNTAVSMGGGFFLEGSKMTIKASEGTISAPVTTGLPEDITGTLIQGNSAGSGGGINFKCYSNESNVRISETVANFNSNVVFKDNRATNGAALAYNLHATDNYNPNANFTFNINGAQFVNNVSTGNGGAIYVNKCREDYNVTVNFNSGTITNNTAKNGGAIAIVTDSDVKVGGTVNMNAGLLSNNSASENGGALYLQNGYFNMKGGIVEENSAANGGSAYITGGDFTMSGGEMKTNQSSQNGGAVYLSDGDFKMSNGSINNNVANANGGAAYVAGGDVTIEHGMINANKATGDTETTGNGGAIYMSASDATLKMESGTMSNNEAANDGGAIYANGGKIYIGLHECKDENEDTLKTCTHHTEKADGRHHPKINENKAGDTGGGIALTKGAVWFYCGEAKDNQALYKGVGKNVFMDGGEFYLYNGADVGVTRDPDLVIVGGTLDNGCSKKNYIKLNYYMTNDTTDKAMTGLAEYEEYMNLPAAEYYWPEYAKENDLIFVGWTAQGAVDNKYVRNKEHYVASGAPVQILDHEPKGAVPTDEQGKETYNNTMRMFDGTENETINLYAIWAPKTSSITYIDKITEKKIEGHTPISYEFNRESNIIDINPVSKPGYDLVGWYIYQDANQNANWNETLTDETYEPVYLNNENTNYSNLNYNQLKYVELATINSVLKLEAGKTNFGNITLIADYKQAYTNLEITKSGANETLDSNQTFIFKVTGDAYVDGTGQGDNDNNPVDIEMEVVINGNGTITIEHLPIGTYTVKELAGWSWRYEPIDKTNGTEAVQEEQSVQLNDSRVVGSVTFNNERKNPYWMDGNSHAQNIFSGTSVIRFPKEQEGGN